jgi:hypothetical protein
MSTMLRVDSVVRGHHVDKSIWTPVIGEELSVEPENGNTPRRLFETRHLFGTGHLFLMLGYLTRRLFRPSVYLNWAFIW